VLLRQGVAVPLGSRAVDVLCTLALAHGDLVGKGRLIAQVWPDTFVEENNLSGADLRAAQGFRGGGRQPWLAADGAGAGLQFRGPDAHAASAGVHVMTRLHRGNVGR
jgi:hypothetical protein